MLEKYLVLSGMPLVDNLRFWLYDLGLEVGACHGLDPTCIIFTYIYIYICIIKYIYIYIFTYTYIYIERERAHVHQSMYICRLIYMR